MEVVAELKEQDLNGQKILVPSIDFRAETHEDNEAINYLRDTRYNYQGGNVAIEIEADNREVYLSRYMKLCFRDFTEQEKEWVEDEIGTKKLRARDWGKEVEKEINILQGEINAKQKLLIKKKRLRERYKKESGE